MHRCLHGEQMNEPPATQPSRRTANEPDYAEMMLRYLGPVVAHAVHDDDVTEIYVNPSDRRVRLHSRTLGGIATESVLESARVELFLNAVAAWRGKILNGDAPQIEAELPDAHFRGSRLQGFVPPITSGPCFTIRKPASVVYSLDDLLEQGVLSPAYRDAIRHAVIDRRNILVVGGTNSGKTTLCNAVIHEMALQCPADRLVILEDTVELQCAAVDHLALRTTGDISLAQLVKGALRVSPSRIIVGEVRDHAALDLLDAWATGHPGGCATLHATSAPGALLRLDRLAQRANVPSQVALIAEAIHLIVVIERSTNANTKGVDFRGTQLRDAPSSGGLATRHVVDVNRVSRLTRDNQFVLQRCTSTGGWERVRARVVVQLTR